MPPELHRGAFTRAHGGTVFLDEIGELPLPSQALLLRVLETGRVCPVGAETETAIDARVVCATHRNLRAMIARGTFRADLFHRLSVLTVEMPALRDRPVDIDVLLDHFAQTHASDVGHPISFAQDARVAGRGAAWTGNVRELRNAVHRAAFVARGAPITAEDLFRARRASTGPRSPFPAATNPACAARCSNPSFAVRAASARRLRHSSFRAARWATGSAGARAERGV